MNLLNLRYSLRSLKNNKFSLFINIFGFAVSLAFVIMIGLYVQKEYSVDGYHADSDRIYMMTLEEDEGPMLSFQHGLTEEFLSNFPQIESGARLLSEPQMVLVPNGKRLSAIVMTADRELFDILSFDFVEGELFAAANDAVVSESFARANFDGQSPLGQTIRIDDKPFNVTGVIKDMENSHISNVGVILNSRSLANDFMYTGYTQWAWCFYVKLVPDTDVAALEKAFTDYANKIPQFVPFDGNKGTLTLLPIKKIYFTKISASELSYNPHVRTNDPVFIAIMLTVGVIILIFAAINYLNLSVAQSGFRAKSTAIQRLLGSSRQGVFWGFILESVGVLIVSGIVAFVIAWLAFPWFCNLMQVRMSFGGEMSLLAGVVIAAIALLMGTLAGWVPAAVISGFSPIEVTRGTFRRKSKSVYSKILITFQYVITIVLFGCSAVIVQQIDFMEKSDKGVDVENIIVCDYDRSVMSKSAKAFVDAVKAVPGVLEVSMCSGYPMDIDCTSIAFKDDEGTLQSHTVIYADSLFFKVFGIEVRHENAYSSDGYWLNETAAQRLGVDENTVEYTGTRNNKFKVRGIVKDFYFDDFTSAIGSMEIQQLRGDSPRNIAIKVSAADRAETLCQIRDIYNQMAGGEIFNGMFMTDVIASYYKTQHRLSSLLMLLSFVAIVISSMGMLAMSIYFTRQRARDMAVRKVFGATPQGVLGLLMGGFLKLVGVAFVIAVPIIYFLMQDWLSGYVYRIKLTPVPFLIAGGVVLVIAVLTVAGHSLKVAMSNPVDSLKAE